VPPNVRQNGLCLSQELNSRFPIYVVEFLPTHPTCHTDRLHPCTNGQELQASCYAATATTVHVLPAIVPLSIVTSVVF
jgi:hypothetical protein